MSSSYPICIFTTLEFASEHARRHSVTPIVTPTFDQPLQWKTLMIIMPEPLDSDLSTIVLCLEMKVILEMIYAPNAVEHILTNKTIARAVHAHLVDAAVDTRIVSKALKVPIPGLTPLSLTAHSFVGSLGLEDSQNIGISVTCIVSM